MPTSASEWPARPRSCGTSMPHRISLRPSVSTCTSIAGADARDQRAQQHPFQPHEILLVGQLDVVLVARHQRHRMAGRLQDGGVVGGARRRRAVQRQQQRKGERLRRLRAVEAGARHGFDDPPVRPAALERVGHRHRRDGARRALAAPPAAPPPCRAARRGGRRRAPARRRARAAPAPPARRSTLCWRVAPPATAGRCVKPRQRRRDRCRRRRRAGSGPPRRPAASRRGGSRAGRPADRNCFGVSAPRRLPVPAATSRSGDAGSCHGAHP